MKKDNKGIIDLIIKNNDIDSKELFKIIKEEKRSVDIDKVLDNNMTFGEKVADKLSGLVGSWPFILSFIGFLISWIILNLYILENNKKFDPYPFILLNLLLSCIASIQAPIIMMSQNRQAKKDSLRNKFDYKTDLKSEVILEELYKKLELILKEQKNMIKYIKNNK